MKIGIDIMGGDFAPTETVKGAILASQKLESEDLVYLFGNENQINTLLLDLGADKSKFIVVDCSQTIEMADDPVKSFMEKSDSSIVKGFKYLKGNIIDGFASAGNTGSMLVGATKVSGVIPGIIRPGISSYYPNNKGGKNLILDVGINPDTKPDVMVQYAEIGNLYSKSVLGVKNPKIGLLNIGEEDTKGNLNSKHTHQLLKEHTGINFIGNVEGGDLNDSDKVDVIVCDGFCGNIVLKQAESFHKIIKSRNISDPYFDNYNYENYGGTPILGIKQAVVVGHGKSNDIAIMNMILHTKEILASKLTEKIIKAFDYGTN